MYEDEIYKKIVTGPDDIIGMLAFALFKEEKFEHIRTIQEDETMQGCSIEEILLHFYKGYNDARIMNLHTRASFIFDNFFSKYSNDLTEEITLDIYKKHYSTIDDIVKKRTKAKPFWYGVVQGVVGSLIFMIILAGILLVSSLIQQKQSYTFSIGVNGLNEVQKTEVQKTDSIKVESTTEQSK